MAVAMTEETITQSLCRSCFYTFEGAGACPSCKKPKVISHPELLDLSIAHIDCDAFYASLEKREHPEYASRPVIIGGEQRGVVSTACYIARMSGVRSAMPMFKAKKLCPDAVIIRGNMKLYAKVGHEIRERMRTLTPLVEPLSIDEAFLDLSGTEKLHKVPPAVLLARFMQEIERDIGITVSVGLAPNKFLAKLGSDMDKPRGYTVIGNSDAVSILSELPITRIYGIGKKTAKTLAKDGLSHISQLQEMDEAQLMRRYGETGQRLYRLARGIDKRRVQTGGAVKSVSSERTLARDVADYDQLENRLWSICESVADDLKQKELAGLTITLKVKTSMHRLVTRSRTMTAPTQLAETLFEVGTSLLKPLTDGTPYRLIGIGVSQFRPLIEADQPDFLEPKRTKKANIERAMDSLKHKFGKATISKGRNFTGAKTASKSKHEN